MDKALSIYCYILKEHLSNCFANSQSINPIEINKQKFNVKAVFIASVIFLKSNSSRNDIKIVSETSNWLKRSFASESLFSTIIDRADKKLISLVDNSIIDLENIDLIDIPTLYEALLGIESIGTDISTGKNYRNKLGSYYTPATFAKSVTKKTIDTFIKLNFESNEKEFLKDISSITFVDFSCGGGNFIISVIDFFEDLFKKWKFSEKIKIKLFTVIASNISAFDVDCLALEVAKLTLLLRINQPFIYKSLSEKFTHANFLLHSESTIDKEKKIEIFSEGFIYHRDLSISKKKLQNYDVILGNPPWEKIRFEEKKFYALYSNTIAENHFKLSRINEINETELNNIQLAEYSKNFKNELELAKADLKKNPFFSLSNNGELNTYALFTEAAIKLKSKRGVIGLILKSATVTSQVNQKLFNDLTKENLIISIFDFINRKKIFNIDSRERFCFLLLGNSKNRIFNVAMNLIEVSEIEEQKSKSELSYDSLRLLNPITGMLPNFSNQKEVDFLLRVSHDFPFFQNVYQNVRFGRIVHFTSHAEFITREKSEDNIPVYEGKFFNQFDGKFSGFNDVSEELRYGSKSSSKIIDESNKTVQNYFPESRFFINAKKWEQLSKNHSEKYMLAWRSLTSATNTRTCIATILPFIPASQSVQFLTTNQNDLLYLSGLFNSIVFDFILKKKISGIDLTQSVINQIPVPTIEQISCEINFNGKHLTVKDHISLLVISLLKNDTRLTSLYEEMILINQIKGEDRSETIKKIDLLFMTLYRLTDPEIELVLAEFGKQYSNKDKIWFKKQLDKLNETISPTITTLSHISPN